MVFTNSEEIVEVLRSLRVHGQGSNKYDNVRIGINARLDAIQAAVLLGKLPRFEWELEQRQVVAKRYDKALAGVATVPAVRSYNRSSWAQYSIRVKDREAVQARLKDAGVPTAVFYPKPLHLQQAFGYLGYKKGDMPISEEVARDIVSLPMHPYMDEKTQSLVIAQVKAALKS